ncbi:MAG: DNA helicase RecQ [Candidatus Sumerlaeia bacterium]|nr:DNA helicase RecQ [Candidatus Sumerlaeia bacterium]
MTTAGRDSLAGLLRRVWGYDRFRPLQREAMHAVMEGRDSLVILPTGGGKSLCFQAPALALDGVALVVSPLISLMKDQVDALRELGVAAGKLHSDQPPGEAREVLDGLRAGTLKLLYISPERLVIEGFDAIARGMPITLLAIDEAHCISEWGHDFRPEYRQLRAFREACPAVPLHAYTATATPKVADEIVRELGLRDPARLVGSFDRPNLFYRVEPRTEPAGQIAEIAARHPDQSGIVYCITRKETERLAEHLRLLDVDALPYHAGLDATMRRETQERFINDQVRIIVATVAFGMGIDKPDVRFVVHAGMPKSLENYQQESGRAGRDGLAAECVLLHSPADFMKWQFVLKELSPEQQRITKRKIESVDRYCNAWSCRRVALLDYFGEKFGEENCASCDVCAGSLEPHEDSLVVAQKILSCVKRLKEEHGPGYTTRVLVGAKDKRIAEDGHEALSTFAILKDHDRGSVRSWIAQLLAQGHLEQAASGEAPLRVTPRGWEVLRGTGPAPVLMRSGTKKVRVSKRAAAELRGVDPELHARLREMRTAIARRRKLRPYIVLSDRSLLELARHRPVTRAALHGIHGIGDARVEHYGDDILRVIRDFLRDHPEAAPKPPAERPAKDRTAVRREAFALLREGRSVEEVAELTKRALSTVGGYLLEMVAESRIDDPTPWVDPALTRRIEDVAAEIVVDGRVRPLYDFFEQKIPFWKLRLVLACAERREGQSAD